MKQVGKIKSYILVRGFINYSLTHFSLYICFFHTTDSYLYAFLVFKLHSYIFQCLSIEFDSLEPYINEIAMSCFNYEIIAERLCFSTI